MRVYLRQLQLRIIFFPAPGPYFALLTPDSLPRLLKASCRNLRNDCHTVTASSPLTRWRLHLSSSSLMVFLDFGHSIPVPMTLPATSRAIVNTARYVAHGSPLQQRRRHTNSIVPRPQGRGFVPLFCLMAVVVVASFGIFVYNSARQGGTSRSRRSSCELVLPPRDVREPVYGFTRRLTPLTMQTYQSAAIALPTRSAARMSLLPRLWNVTPFCRSLHRRTTRSQRYGKPLATRPFTSVDTCRALLVGATSKLFQFVRVRFHTMHG